MASVHDRPGPFFRVAVVTAVALSTLVVVCSLLALIALPGCGPAANAKPILRQVDEHVQLACEGLAQALGERSGADVKRIIATSCAVEGVTRLMRELLLSEQIRASTRAGVAVPVINSGALEPDPYDPAEAAAE